MNLRNVFGHNKIFQFAVGFVAACIVLAGGLLAFSFLPVERPAAVGSVKKLPDNRQASFFDVDRALIFEHMDRISDASLFERALALDSVLRQSDAELVKQLFVQSKRISSFGDRTDVQRELLSNLANFDPVQALDLLENNPRREQRLLAASVFQEWASVDLDSAIEHASTLYPFFLREVAFRAMLEVREDLSQEEKEHIGRKLQQSDFAIQEATILSGMTTASSCEERWQEMLGSSRPFDLKYSALVDLAQNWIDQEGLIAISKISDTTTDWTIRQNVLRESIRWSARSDPKSTFEFSLSSFRDTDFNLVVHALRFWVEREPENALSAIARLETNKQQKELYRNAISQWAVYEPREVLGYLELLPEKMQDHAQQEAYSNIRHLSSQEVTQLATRHLGGFWEFDASVLLSNWKNYAFEEALDWTLTNSTHERTRASWADSLFNGLTPSVADIALKRIFEEPLRETEVGFEAYIVGHLADSDVGAALNLLSRLRNDKTRARAIWHTGARMAIRSNYETAWKFADGLPESERVEFYARVIPSWLSNLRYSPSSVLSQIGNLPSPKLRSLVALQTIQLRRATKNISQSDETKLKEYLLEEDLERLNQSQFVITH